MGQIETEVPWEQGTRIVVRFDEMQRLVISFYDASGPAKIDAKPMIVGTIDSTDLCLALENRTSIPMTIE